MFVSGVVIRNEIQSLIGRRDVVDDPQELQPFLMPMWLLAHADDGAIEDVESSEQAGRPVALVVLGHGPRPAFNGSPGWVRSSARIWLFSSTDKTRACSGGFIYSPTMASSFWAKSGSRL